MPTTRYVWDEVNDSVIQEQDGLGNTTAQITYEPVKYGQLISERRSGVDHHHHHDGQGNTRALTNDSGNVTDTWVYTAFGTVEARTGTTESPYQFGGEYGYQTDSLTGDIYIRERIYEPLISRWLSTDPIPFEDGVNLYEFCHNNPITYIDPSGLWCALCCCCADGLKLTKKPRPIMVPGTELIGHEFFVEAKVSYVVDKKGGDCSLEWWEWSTRFPRDAKKVGAKNKEWFQFYPKLESDTFKEWVAYEKDKKKPCPGPYDPITMRDAPVTSGDRTVGFEIIVSSTPDCKCKSKSKTLRLVQTLEYDKKTFTPVKVELIEVDDFDEAMHGVPKRKSPCSFVGHYSAYCYSALQAVTQWRNTTTTTRCRG